MKRKIANVVISFLLVTSMVMASTGMASAQSTGENCNSAELAVTWVTSGLAHLSDSVDCHVFGSGGTTEAVNEVRDAETNQTKLDLYMAAQNQKASNDITDSIISNYASDLDTVAWSKAEVAIAEAYEEGATQSEAKTQAKEAIAEYIATKQKNLNSHYNVTVLGFKYIDNRAEQEGFGNNYAYIEDATAGYVNFVHEGFNNVTLVNGDTVRSAVYNSPGSEESGSDTDLQQDNEEDITNAGESRQYGYQYLRFGVSAPNSNHEDLTYTSLSVFRTTWSDLQSKNDELQSESDVFVDAIWSKLENGELSTEDIISRNTQMFEYGTTNSNNRTYYDVIGAIASMGLDTPDLNGTGQMSVYINETGETHNGMVFARNVPNGNWEIGKTYNAGNITGPVMYATTNGSTDEINGNFVITEAKTKDGDSVQTVETIEYNYQTSNTSELLEKQDRILQLTQELQNRSETVGTGGSTVGSDMDLPPWLEDKYGGVPVWGWLIIVALVGYVFNSARGN